jgi:outer membrane protein assembly factor BamB
MAALNAAPRKTRFFFVLLAAVVLSEISSAQNVALSTKSGPPTTKISVSGSGFPAAAAVDIYFDTSELALTVTTAAGSFSDVEIQVPASALPGTNWVTAVVQNSGEAAQAAFKVQTNWPQFQFADNNSGANPYENVLSVRNAPQLGVRWIATIEPLNIVGSEPVIVNGVIYLSSFNNNVYALDADTGAQLWQFGTGGPIETNPTVAGGVVYVGSDDGNIYALKASDGTELWKFNTGFNVSSSATVVDGVVYIGGLFTMYALNANTGAIVWQYYAGYGNFFGFSIPAVVDGVVYIGNDNNVVYALNASNGSLNWQFTTGNFVNCSPAVVDGVVYVCSADGNLYALNSTTGAELWQFATGNVLFFSPAVVNGAVYAPVNNTLYALNATYGTELWSLTINGVSESSAVANGVLYVSSCNDVYAFNAENGTQLWQYAIGGCGSGPSVVNGTVYVTSGSNVYAFTTNPAPKRSEHSLK